MTKLTGFGAFAALPDEQLSEKISRRILSGSQGTVVWWSTIWLNVPRSDAEGQAPFFVRVSHRKSFAGAGRIFGAGKRGRKIDTESAKFRGSFPNRPHPSGCCPTRAQDHKRKDDPVDAGFVTNLARIAAAAATCFIN
jgi:hypothetical protein